MKTLLYVIINLISLYFIYKIADNNKSNFKPLMLCQLILNLIMSIINNGISVFFSKYIIKIGIVLITMSAVEALFYSFIYKHSGSFITFLLNILFIIFLLLCIVYYVIYFIKKYYA